jgi:hypothetical protein
LESFFHYSNTFPRVLRILTLFSSVISILFIQAVTYNFRNPDDGSCEIQSTKFNCLSIPSTFNTGEKKCYWDDSDPSDVPFCHFVKPDSQLLVVLYVAAIAAILSMPIVVVVDWIIMNILIRPVLRHGTIVPDNSSLSKGENENRKLKSSMENVKLEYVNVDMNHLILEIAEHRKRLNPKDLDVFDSTLIHKYSA